MTDIAVDSKVIVKIFGEEYPLAATDDAAYISKVADYVDARMQSVAKRSRSQSRDKIAILSALSIASELLEKSTTVNELQGDLETRVDGLIQRLDRALNDSGSATG